MQVLLFRQTSWLLLVAEAVDITEVVAAVQVDTELLLGLLVAGHLPNLP
jgi:hypothetical protein